MSLKTLILRYSIFAGIAALANLLAQRLVLTLGKSSWFVAGAMVLGTIVGLVLKYILDKRLIFFDTTSGMQAHSEKFRLYCVMGLITTAIFWVFEITFWYAWPTNIGRESGAIVGLTIGYIVKYSLDKRFVFNGKRSGVPA